MSKTKIEPLVNLNINPCKMCMPMGAVSAFYGIKKCMSILHGSQGCSTYIRRHMATHYNEPVDIASSSLTEEGTVYGGEKNLLKGLKNLIDLYNPEVIGVSTTCLAETIGEDVPRIIEKFYEENPDHRDIIIIPVNSPGYGGTQFEGYFRALHSIVSKTEMKLPDEIKETNYINIITSPISPSDTRFLKKELDSYGIKYIFLPDISENLDGEFNKEFSRIPLGGTDIKDIQKMSGAKVTIELTSMETNYSPGKYLQDNYGVPLVRLNLPVGLRDSDEFYKQLGLIAGVKKSESRGRYLDAMVDSHKYCSDARAVVFGEPDFVYSTVRLCVENGVMPVLVATGSVCSELKEKLESEIVDISKRYFIDEFEIIDDVDFKIIEEKAKKLKANVLIGNSDGRRIEESLGIPLVRRGFPIHDRVGGQRLKMLGYEGSLTFMDDIANAVLARKESGFREELYEKYFEKQENIEITEISEIEEKTKNHPCFNGCGGKTARMHLPIAPKCNIQCNYCVRKFDCPNESRPGVTTKVLTPKEAFEKYKLVKGQVENLTVVGIAGPGDALANFEETKKTLELIREYDKDVIFCLSTNGLMLPRYADEIIKLGVSHVTVTMNAVDIKIGAKIYKYINYEGIRFEGESAAAILLANQLSGLRILTAAGVVCKVNIVTLKGINDKHIPEVVKTVKEIGCFITNIMPFIQVEGSEFEHLETTSNKEIMKIRNSCGEIMQQMYHCKQCRADAIGTLDNDISVNFEQVQDKDEKYTFAIASKSGIMVDLHFGHAEEFYIYEYNKGKVKFKDKKKIDKYCVGEEDCDDEKDKISGILKAIGKCDGVIAMRIGEEPKRKLKEKGIRVFSTCELIEDAVKSTANNM